MLQRSAKMVATFGAAIMLLGAYQTASAHDNRDSGLRLKSIGARAFGGKRVPFPNNPTSCIGSVCQEPTNYLYCDHGYADWRIPENAREYPFVFTHGAGTRAYETTFDGQPGFQTIFLKQRYSMYIVDLPWTGRAGLACEEFVYDGPTHTGWSSKFVFSNRIGIPAPAGQEGGTFFPGVAFSRDPKALDQYFRVQYAEFNGAAAEERESAALAVLLNEVKEKHRKGGILVTHSSGATRGWAVAQKTDNIGAIVTFEPGGFVFPSDAPPPPALRANGGTNTYNGPFVTPEQFKKLTKFPMLVIYGDNIPRVIDPANATGPGVNLDDRRIARDRAKLFTQLINARGGRATFLDLPQVGVRGNTHYAFADTNVNAVANQVTKWLAKERLDKKCSGRHC